MGAGAAVNYSDLPKGAKVLSAPGGGQSQFSDLPPGATVLPEVDRMTAGHGPASPPPQKWQGSFYERATSQLGEDLRDPENLGLSLLNMIPGVNVRKVERSQYAPDSAETVGHFGVPALLAAVTGAFSPRPIEAKPPRIPLWQQIQSEGTEVPSIFNRQPYAQPARPRLAQQVSQPAQTVTAAAPETKSLLDQLSEFAAKIEREGHGEEPLPEEESQTLNMNQDLTPALKKSLAKVRAAKRPRASTP